MAISLATPFIPSLKLPSTSNNGANTRKLPSFQAGGRWRCRKQGGVHPDFYEDAKVYCNEELVMTTGGTQEAYNVDVWSGNQPFYLSNRSALLVDAWSGNQPFYLSNRSALLIDADQVEKFRNNYGEFSSLMEIPVLRQGEFILPQRKKGGDFD